MSKLTAEGSSFLLDGQPFRILSGAIHYFRVPREYWQDRLIKLKACGFNTLETYVPWNLHEPQEGYFNFSGNLDIAAYLELAAQLELKVIIRPGPYICAEWELGGLPPWLIADENMRIRCFYPPYLEKLDRYLDNLLPRLRPYLASEGGPIIAMQVENEYGSYGNDKKYLEHIREKFICNGMDCLFFTSDGPCYTMLTGGTLPDVFKGVNFGSRPEEAFALLKERQPDAPLMCCEFWDGWFDHWGDGHHVRDPKDVADVFDRMLTMGASVSFYMFHGGTNFGFMNGANRGEEYQPTVGSYDYDALLTESGEITEKYRLCKQVIEKHFGPVPELSIQTPPKRAYGPVKLEQSAPLFENLTRIATLTRSACTLSMEKVGQSYGFILYRTRLTGPTDRLPLVIREVRDRALVFVDGVFQGTIYRDREDPEHPTVTLELKAGEEITLDILVENMGRVNYGPSLIDHKGITQGVQLGYQFLFDWEIYSLPLEDLSPLCYSPVQAEEAVNLPAFYKGSFQVEQRADCFIHLPGFEKGVVFVNGFNLGRYWSQPPQRSLYLPAPLLREGANCIEVFELHHPGQRTVILSDKPDLGEAVE